MHLYGKENQTGTELRLLKKTHKILQPFEKSITYKMSQAMNSVRLPDRHPSVSPIDSNTNM
jgi:hypothetical protein